MNTAHGEAYVTGLLREVISAGSLFGDFDAVDEALDE